MKIEIICDCGCKTEVAEDDVYYRDTGESSEIRFGECPNCREPLVIECTGIGSS